MTYQERDELMAFTKAVEDGETNFPMKLIIRLLYILAQHAWHGTLE